MASGRTEGRQGPFRAEGQVGGGTGLEACDTQDARGRREQAAVELDVSMTPERGMDSEEDGVI